MEESAGSSTPRNPPWVDEELILALDVYLCYGQLGSDHPVVIELSQVLNRLPVHRSRPDVERFRNPNGVALELANFAAIDPAYPGKGMTRGGKRDAMIWAEFHGDEDAVGEAAARIRRSLPWRTPSRLPIEVPSVRRRPIERLGTRSFSIRLTKTESQGERRELVLVHDFAAQLIRAGHTVNKHDYPIETAAGILSCDLFDETAQVLYEAKSGTSREAIRMAVGQLFDYRRFEPDGVTPVVLLPRRPTPDLEAYLNSCGVGLVWRQSDRFESSDPDLVPCVP